MINKEMFRAKTKLELIQNICKMVFFVCFVGAFIFICLAWASFDLAVCGCQIMPLSYVATIIWHVFAVLGVVAFFTFCVCCALDQTENN